MTDRVSSRPAGPAGELGRSATAIVAELEQLGLLVSGDTGPSLDPRIRGLARSTAAGALVEVASELRRLGRIDAATESLTKAIAQLDEGASEDRGRALRLLARTRRDAGDLDGALAAHTKAEYVFGTLGDLRAQAWERCALGRIHMEQGRLGDAQRTFVQVLDGGANGGEIEPALIAQAGLVEVRARRGDFGEAIDTLQAGLTLARSERLGRAEAVWLSAIAFVEGLGGDAAKSDEAYAAAVELLRSRGKHRATATLHAVVAERRAVRGDVAGAQEAIRAAEAVVGAGRDTSTLAAIALARGSVLEMTGDLTGALAAYWETVDLARRAAATAIDHEACLLSAQLDPDQTRATGYVGSALLALAREGDRALFVARPALAASLRARIDVLGIRAEDRPAVVELLTVSAPKEEQAGINEGGLQVSLLGALDVRIGGQRVSDRAWRTSKAKELFSLLLLHRARALERDEIIERLWPEAEPASGISSFHFTLHALRKALASTSSPCAPTVRTEGGYQLITAEKAPVDVDIFLLLLHEAQRFRRAGRPDDAVRLFRATAALYRGDLLTDLSAEWVAERREDLVRRFLSALRQLAELEIERDDGTAAVDACRRYLEREPYDEHIHRILMRAYHSSGDRALVDRHYRSLTDLLRRELRTEPERETTQLYQRLRGKDGGPGQLAPVRVTR